MSYQEPHNAESRQTAAGEFLRASKRFGTETSGIGRTERSEGLLWRAGSKRRAAGAEGGAPSTGAPRVPLFLPRDPSRSPPANDSSRPNDQTGT